MNQKRTILFFGGGMIILGGIILGIQIVQRNARDLTPLNSPESTSNTPSISSPEFIATSSFREEIVVSNIDQPAPSLQDLRQIEWQKKAQRAKEDSQTWPVYVNKNLGISFKYPKEIYVGDDRESDQLIFFQVGDIIFMTNASSSFYEHRGELRKDDNTILQQAQQLKVWPDIVWGIQVRDINSEKEIDTFIKDKYGAGCIFAGKNESSLAGVYNFGIEAITPGDGDSSSCFLNWVIGTKYSPKFHRAAMWDMGQDYSLSLSDGYPADGILWESFSFLERKN